MISSPASLAIIHSASALGSLGSTVKEIALTACCSLGMYCNSLFVCILPRPNSMMPSLQLSQNLRGPKQLKISESRDAFSNQTPVKSF